MRMKELCFDGGNKVLTLIQNGHSIEQICDSYGRSVHPDADEFLAYHRQAKRMLIKQCIERYNSLI